MKQIFHKAQQHLLKNDVWLFVVTMFGISLIMVNENETMQELPSVWGRFFAAGIIFMLVQFPALLFTKYKSLLKERLNFMKYAVLWLGTFVCYPIVVYLIEINSLRWGRDVLQIRDNYDAEVLVVTCLVSFWVALVLEVNAFFNAKSKLIQWVQRIGIDRAIIGIIGFFSVLLGAMGASNKWAIDQYQRIEPDFNLGEFFVNFPDFISYTIQFGICYGTLYFFYYVNRYFLIPKFLKEKGLLYFAGGVLGTIVIAYPILSQIVLSLPLNEDLNNGLIPSNTTSPFDPLHGAIALMIIAFSTPVILIIEWFQQNHEIVSLQKQRAETELNLLKQQINPHFFFNTLNNLYSLSIQQSMQTPEVILQLSELMRYVIYKGQNDLVTLEEEMKYIKDYIQLQQIRLQRKLDLQFDLQIANGKAKIPPLLLIILVENAFKHGIEPAEDAAYLHIVAESDDEHLSFICKNSYEPLVDKREGGLGLTNLKRRLDLRFPDQHELYLYDDDFSFEAAIKLNLA